ncbi:hypothetical protein CM15mP94_1880 [bacterium]|nr:MAG: hypothetical protein CM15mP94_1880 [bacterium]
MSTRDGFVLAGIRGVFDQPNRFKGMDVPS